MPVKKIILLSLALLLPVGIFLFLKTFGRNQFDVPPLHQEKWDSSISNCEATYTLPYKLADSTMARLRSVKYAQVYVVNFSESESVVQSIEDEIAAGEAVVINGEDLIREDQVAHFRDCVFLLALPYNVVAIDSAGRIRGYYDGNDREDTDRMEVEIKIILKKY